MSDEEEKDYSSGDEYNSDDENQEQQQIQGVYRDWERIGGIVDDEMNINATELQMAQLTPEERFKIKFQQHSQELNLSRDIKEILQRSILRIPLIQYKNPLLYILGYLYLQNSVPSGYQDLKVDIVRYSRFYRSIR